MFKVLYTREARERLEEIARSDSKSARIIFDHLKKLPETFRSDPFLVGSHFKGLRRNRIGKYRVIYRALEAEKQIHVITIDLRKSAYG